MKKVIGEVRRCGKSSLMKPIRNKLMKFSMPGRNLIFLNLDSKGYKPMKSPENAYRGEEELSFPVTGPNSYLSSGELVTKLTGRYMEFEMLTLIFEEYIGMKKFYRKEKSL